MDIDLSIIIIMSKRKLPRREFPYLSTLLDRIPYSKLPTNGVVLRRLMFELEQQNGKTSVATSAVSVKDELIGLWEYAGYGDILHQPGYIVRQSDRSPPSMTVIRRS